MAKIIINFRCSKCRHIFQKDQKETNWKLVGHGENEHRTNCPKCGARVSDHD